MFTRISIARPKATIAAWLIVAAVLAPFAVLMPHALQAGGFSNPRAEAFTGQDIAERQFGDPLTTAAIVLNSDAPVPDSVMEAAATAASSIPGVDSTTDYRSNPALRSSDGTAAVVIANFSSDNTATQNAIPHLRDAVSDAVDSDSISSHVTGQAALDYDLNMQSEKDALHAELIAFPLLIVVLLFVYRAVGPTLITLTLAGIALALTRGIGYLLGQGFAISNLYTTGVSLIGLAVAVDYSLFIIKRFREQLDLGATPAQAAHQASRTAGHAVRFGGLAVIVALAALYIPRNMVFSSIATAGIIVTLTAIALTMTFLPAVLTLLGQRTYWLPFATRPQRTQDENRKLWAVRHRIPVAAVLIASFAMLAIPLSGLKLQVPVASASILPAGTDSRAGIEILNDKLNAQQLFPVQVIVSGTSPHQVLATTASVVDTAQADSRVSSVLHAAGDVGAQDIQLTDTGQLNQAGTVFATDDGQNTYARIFVVSKYPPDSDQTHELVSTLRTGAASGDTEIYVSGATAIGTDFDQLVSSSIPWIVLTVALLTIALLGYAFRSIYIPILALALNGLVVAASLGFLTGLWKLLTSENINSVTPIVMFAIMFGLSMDYMVLMASRMKEIYLDRGDHDLAIAAGSRRTARLVTSAAIIMIAVFLSFLVAEVSIVRQLGIGLAVAVFFDAVIIRPFLMPAVLSLAGSRIWGRSSATEPQFVERPLTADTELSGAPKIGGAAL